MFLPIGDTPNPSNFKPWINWSLIGLNIFVYLFISLPMSSQGVSPKDPALLEYIRALGPGLGVSAREILAQIRAYDLFVFAHGYKPGAPQITDLFFSLFLHGGLFHLLGNMLFLWIYGDNVEHRLGRLGYLVAYLATGVMATLTFGAFASQSMTPLVGASGAISGVLGIYFLLFPRNKIKVLFVLFPFFVHVFLWPARLVLGFYLIVDNLLPVLFSTQSNVAFGAHIGGFIGGLGLAWFGERTHWTWPWNARGQRLGGPRRIPIRPKTARSASAGGESTSSANLYRLRTAISAGDAQNALESLYRLDRADLAKLTSLECVLLARWLEEAGMQVAAQNLLRQCIATHGSRGDLAQVYLQLGVMRLKSGQPTAAYQHLLTVFDYNPDAATEAQARALLQQISVNQRSLRKFPTGTRS